MCPQCARVWDNGKALNPSMPISDLNLNDYKILLEPFADNKLNQILHCGNFGDVIASPTFIETFDYSLDFTNKVQIETNGSARKTNWWQDLAKRSKNKLIMIFSIDGLKDTNHIYRVGSTYEKIIENANAFINAGGKADWAMLVFKHNEHQVEDCKLLAQEYGFLNFTYRPSHRWVQDYTPVFDKNKKEEYRIYPASVVEEKGITKFFEPPKAPPPNSHIKYDVETANDLPTPNNKCNIECKVLPINGSVNNSIYLAADGRIWPCCWTASHHDRMLSQNFKDDFIKEFYQKKGYKQNFNNTKIHTIKKIFQTEMFDFYPKTWPKDNPHPACRYSCDVKSNFNIQENLTNGSSFK